jgi:predicted HicB family RNase H-like nuclease
MMEYKGYTAKVEFDDEAEIIHGEVIGIKDVITFQGKTVGELKKAFRESVDDYLSFCEERGEAPDKPFTGKFVVRVSPELHRKIYLSAKLSNESINAWLNEKLECVVNEELKECGV